MRLIYHRVPIRRLAALLCAAALPGLSACGTNGITGGGVPVGGTRAEQSGQAVEASNPTQPVGGAVVTLTAADGSTYTTTTDATGNYDFPSAPVGLATLKVEPPSSLDLLPASLPVDVRVDSRQSVVAALAPRSGSFSVSAILLRPDSLHLNDGDRASVTVTLVGTGIPAGAIPSLVVQGGVGHILPTGAFQATHPGVGSLAATLDGASASIPITVTAGRSRSGGE